MSQYHSTPEDNSCHESHDEMLAYAPKPPNNPSISQHDHDACNDDTHMKDAAVVEEKNHAHRQSTSDQKDARAEIRELIP